MKNHRPKNSKANPPKFIQMNVKNGVVVPSLIKTNMGILISTNRNSGIIEIS